jgi:hypothetical protein
LKKEFEEYKTRAQSEIRVLNGQLKEMQVKLEHVEEQIAKEGDDHSDTQNIFKAEIDSLRKSIGTLELTLSEEQKKHAREMADYSANLNDRLKKLQITQRKTLDECEESKQH